MNLCAIVPVKPLEQAKSRLADALSPADRAALVHALLLRTLGVLRQVSAVTDILVVTGDPGIAAAVAGAGERVLRSTEAPDLNRDLALATQEATSHHAEAVLVLHADLPLVQAEDVMAMVSSAHAAPVVVVAPDRSGHGTNAMLCRPPGLIEYQFGPDSFARHCAQARAAGATLEVCSLSGLAQDLDRPEDLKLLNPDTPGPTLFSPQGPA